MLLRSGLTLAGYRIDDVVGIGGMGVVYRARQLSLDRPVALKVLSPGFAEDESFRARFQREAMQMAALEHPNIVPIYEAGTAEDRLFIAMRFIDGSTLADQMRGRLLSGARTLDIIAAIAGALDIAHAAGLVHRDVKPQNILLTTSGYPYLADFGIAKGVGGDRLTRTGAFMGSIHYSSPEQIRGENLTAATDVYALATVAFECLTSRAPYEADSDAAVMHAHLTKPPPRFSEVTENAPADLDLVFSEALAKEPKERPARAIDFADALRSALAEVPAQRLAKAIPLFPPPRETPVAVSNETRADVPGGRRDRLPIAAATSPEVTDKAMLLHGDATRADTGRSVRRSRTEVAERPGRGRPRISFAALRLPAAVIALAAFFGLGTLAFALLHHGVRNAEQTASVSGARLHFRASAWRAHGPVAGSGARAVPPGAVVLASRSGATSLFWVGALSTKAAAARRAAAAFPKTPKVTPVQFGRFQAEERSGPLKANNSLLTILVGASPRYFVMGCEAPTGSFRRFEASCRSLAANSDLSTVKPVRLYADPAALRRVEAVEIALGAAQHVTRAGLASHDRFRRATAAARLAGTYRSAARRLPHRSFFPASSAASVDSLRSIFVRTARDLGRVSASFRAKDRGVNDRARGAVRSDQIKIRSLLIKVH